jgi:ubiquinol-cytochrome c reductase cytochrome b subunit
MEKIGTWLDERLGLRRFWRAIFHRHLPVGLNWWYSLGAATLFVLVLQVATGILLALNYAPTPDHAYDSVLYITETVPFGWIVRGLHHWGASAMVVLVVLHLVTAFILGAYKYPREATWLVGVILLLVTLGFGFTGYLLPWDQKAYWATTVGTNMPGTAPFIGSWLTKLIRGGTDVGAVTLTRFYAVHVLVLPAMLAFFVLVHLALVVWHGVSVPPKLWHEGLRRWKGLVHRRESNPALAPAMEPLRNSEPLSSDQYHERYEAFEVEGPRFWPDMITDDLIIALIVFMVLLALTIVLGIPWEPRADPTDTAYIPRPDWYFMFLFQFVKYFPGYLEWVGILVVPGLFVLLLLLIPFLSRGRERRPRRRPVAMGILSIIAVSVVALTVEAYRTTPPSTGVEHGMVLTARQLRGKQLIVQQGCRSCHVINGQGTKQKGPPLDGIRTRMTAADIHSFMEAPGRFNPAATMKPVIPPLSHYDVEAITQYLLTLPARTSAEEGGNH